MVRRLRKRRPGLHPMLLDQVAIGAETEAHLNRLRAIAGDADRVVDKMPENAMLLGHIAILFPCARIIYCKRDPRDICLSSFFQQFGDPTPWSYDLESCAVKVRETDRMMKFWLDTVPLRILEIQYEALIADLEGQSRRLIGFLGLDWDPACLAFHKTDRQVLSASQWQVRQPLYNSSVARWRNYGKHLGPLSEGLKGLIPTDDAV